MKKKNFILLIIIIIVVIGIIYFNNLNQKKEEKIKIGVILPLTGFLANTGIDTKNAIELAYTDSNSSDIELIYEDDACDATKALTAYRKLVDIDNVDFIIGPFCGQSAMSVLGSINSDKVIAISPGAPDNELAKPDDYFFRTRVSNKDETLKIVEFLAMNKTKRVAVYTAKNTFGKSYRDSFRAQLPNYIEVVYDDGSSDYQTDFKTDIIKIKEKSPQAIFLVPASRQQMGIFVKQMNELKLNYSIFGGSVTEQQDLLDAAGNAADGIIYPYVSPKNLSIVNRYKEKYGKNPSMEVLNGYDAFKILYTEIKKCDGNKECVKGKLNNLKDFEGAMGKISFDENGDTKVELILKTIKNREFVKYEE